ncbi:ROK family transcriptional regulator [Asticcacaulis machinosus]|uniref:ROK family transcriptional regulator n=1 Tax=Asticcacaulis machinosus TaxID=2984211 RepID=A0ABT5HHI9_9CAUL|nr:ROK family transcriptional regulator [Asticcacaulis machinosus]MDC7675581.1 ROK family transcriptional regulator [Asticcacaulis machinosus]
MSLFFLDSLQNFDDASTDGSESTEKYGGTNIARAADRNLWLTLQAIRAHGLITRVELARMMGLTGPAISNITNQLIRTKLVKKAGRIEGMRGQPAQKLCINPDGAFSLGLNIDRDHLTFVVLDFSGNVRFRISEEIAFSLPEDVLAFLKTQIDHITKKRIVDVKRIIGLGIGMPDDLGEVRLPGQPDSYHLWSETDIQRLLSETFHLPVYIENDAAAASIGEMHFGKGLKLNSFFYLLFSSGLGGGLVINQRYHRGAHGRSGELSFLPLIHPTDPTRTDLGKTVGDAFVFSDLRAQFRNAGYDVEHPDDIKPYLLSESDIIDAWIDNGVDFLTLPLLAMIYSVDPEMILIGGRLPPALIDRLCEKLGDRLRVFGSRLTLPPILQADLAEDAPALGAAALAFNDRFIAHVRNAMRVEA